MLVMSGRGGYSGVVCWRPLSDNFWMLHQIGLERTSDLVAIVRGPYP